MELIGYIASILVLISLMMSNVWKLRILNLFGSFTFTIYGLAIHAYPIFVVNALISIINIYYLINMRLNKDYFNLLHIDPKSDLIIEFLAHHASDLKRIFPNFDLEKIESPHAVFILRQLMPVGLFIYEIQNENEAYIHLDYVSKDYRDLKNALFLYTHLSNLFNQKPIKKIITETNVISHMKYLKEVGFNFENNFYIKRL